MKRRIGMNWNYKALQSQTDDEYEFISNVLNDLVQSKSKIKILDVGCSDGYNTIKMFRQFDNIEVVGIDISQDAIQKAQDRIDENVMVFECINIEDVNELNDFYSRYGKFDIVYCSHLVQHLKDVFGFVKKVHYFLLKPKGYFIIKTIDDSTKQANQQNDILHYVLQYYQKYVAPFQELRRYTNRYIGNDISNILDEYYHNIIRYEYQQTTEGLSQEDRLRLFDRCFHFRGLSDCMRHEIPQDKEYLDALARLKESFTEESYVFSTKTLLFVAQNN